MNYLEGFLDFCKYQRGLSDNTLRSYRIEVAEYLEWLRNRKLKLTTIKVKDIDTYLIFLRKEKGGSVGTANHKMYALKVFYRWLQRVEIVKTNPLELFQNIKAPKPLPRYLTEDEQNTLLLASQNGFHTQNWLKKRDYLMILFFLDTGLRVSELCGIKVKDLNFDQGVLRITGKGSKEREIVLSNRCLITVKEYLDVIREIGLRGSVDPGLPARGFNLRIVAEELNISKSLVSNIIFIKNYNEQRVKKIQGVIDEKIKPLPLKYLFFAQTGRPLNSRHVFRIVQGIGQRAGIKNLHPHILRHSFATNLRRKGGDLLLISEAMGHSSVSTTQVYAHLESKDYREGIRRLID